MPEPSEPKPPARKSQLLELFGIALSGGWAAHRLATTDLAQPDTAPAICRTCSHKVAEFVRNNGEYRFEKPDGTPLSKPNPRAFAFVCPRCGAKTVVQVRAEQPGQPTVANW